MNRLQIILLCLAGCCSLVAAQLPKQYTLDSASSSNLPLTNAINDIVVRNDSVWFGTEQGLSLTTSGGTRWLNYSGTNGFDSKGVSALAIKDDNIWVALGYSTTVNDESVQTGGGFHFSTDHGATWSFIPQPVDHGTVDTLLYGTNKIRALDITVPQQNITFDLALTKQGNALIVWTASWAGMLRKSIDTGRTWQRVVLPPDDLDHIAPTDSLSFDLSPASGKLGLISSNNHLLFSVYASDDSTIWAGTADGINKSTDGGISWRKFSHQNQVHAISGDFVVALKEQVWGSRRIMWAATVNANDPNEIKGVSYSQDGGETWSTTLLNEWAHNIDVRDSIVYVATDNGLFRSADFGQSWARNGSIYDPTNLQRFVSTACFGIGAEGDTIWYGGGEGIAYTRDSPSDPFASRWRIFRTAEQIGSQKKTYAFPNPFSPSIEPVRLHISLATAGSGSQAVTIRIYDFAMQPVRTVLQNASRLIGKEYDEIWDGKTDNNSVVANGVYFYRVEIGNDTPVWGKILVAR